MSKFKKLFLSAFAVAALAFGFGMNPVTAYAEDSVDMPVISSEIETSEEVIEESASVENSSNLEAETSEESNGKIIAKTKASEWFEETIKPMAIQFGVTGAAVVIVWFFASKKMRKLERSLAEAVDLVKQSHKENVDVKAENAKWKKEIEEHLLKGVKNIGKEVHKLLTVEKIAYETNTKLVSNGTAKKIAEVINEEKNDH